MYADRGHGYSQTLSRSQTCRRRRSWLLACAAGLAGTTLWIPAGAADLSQTIAAIKPSVVAIATYQKLRSPATVFFGTGFVVGDGLTIITNAHVVTASINVDKVESLGVLIGNDGAAEFRPAVLIDSDPEHDLARLRIGGTPLPALRVGDSAGLLEGQGVAFTGFPLGMALGLTKVTHRGMISAITPVIRPAMNSSRLDLKSIAQLQKSAYSVFQLDGTAYPGNSGSPLYDPETGVVFGIINMVFIKGLKETAITNPSGITYAIPGNYIRSFLDQKH